jgi:hypothetical protein
MATAGDKRRAEEHMAEWLSHPLEFGVPPASIRYRRSYRGTLVTQGDVEIHLVEYAMPDGTHGRGFVNGPLTWSFIGEEVNAIGDDDLLQAYCGWSWLFPALQGGSVETDFVSETEEPQFLDQKREEGFENIVVTDRYRIGDSELFEFTAIRDGVPVKGAGNTEDDVAFPEDDPRSFLPAIYFLLARHTIKAME